MKHFLFIFFFISISTYSQKINYYGGFSTEIARDIVKSPLNDGYYFISSTRSFTNEGNELYLVKVNNNLTEVWSKHFGFEGVVQNSLQIPTKNPATTLSIDVFDGAIYILSDPFFQDERRVQYGLFKFSLDGNLLEKFNYGDSIHGRGFDLNINSLGHICIPSMNYVDGGTYGFGVFMTNTSLDSLWCRDYGDLDEISYGDYATCAVDMLDNSWIVAGNLKSKLFLVKINENGDTLWTRKYLDLNDGNNLEGGAVSMVKVGEKIAIVTLQRVLLLDTQGDTLWTRQLPFEEDNYNYSVTAIGNEKILVTGLYGISYYILDLSGDIVSSYRLVDYNDYYSFNCIVDDESIVVVGSTNNYSQAFLFKDDFDISTCIVETSPVELIQSDRIVNLVSRNNIEEVDLYDLSGCLRKRFTDVKTKEFTFENPSETGVFIIRIKTGRSIIAKKIIF